MGEIEKEKADDAVAFFEEENLELDGDGFTMVPIRQGFGSLSAPSKAFERAVMSLELRPGGHPLL